MRCGPLSDWLAPKSFAGFYSGNKALISLSMKSESA
jgi:hypothetical protein